MLKLNIRSCVSAKTRVSQFLIFDESLLNEIKNSSENFGRTVKFSFYF